MRRAIVPVLLFLVGCVKPTLYYAPVTSVNAIDFRPHTADGFLFSPNPYEETHQAIGMVTLSIRAEARAETNDSGFREWHFTRIPVDTALARLKAAAQGMGADGVVNFEIRGTSETVSVNLSIPVIEVSGLAIRRTR